MLDEEHPATVADVVTCLIANPQLRAAALAGLVNTSDVQARLVRLTERVLAEPGVRNIEKVLELEEKLRAAESELANTTDNACRMHYLGNLIRSRSQEEQDELTKLMRKYPPRVLPTDPTETVGIAGAWKALAHANGVAFRDAHDQLERTESELAAERTRSTEQLETLQAHVARVEVELTIMRDLEQAVLRGNPSRYAVFLDKLDALRSPQRPAQVEPTCPYCGGTRRDPRVCRNEWHNDGDRSSPSEPTETPIERNEQPASPPAQSGRCCPSCYALSRVFVLTADGERCPDPWHQPASSPAQAEQEAELAHLREAVGLLRWLVDRVPATTFGDRIHAVGEWHRRDRDQPRPSTAARSGSVGGEAPPCDGSNSVAYWQRTEHDCRSDNNVTCVLCQRDMAAGPKCGHAEIIETGGYCHDCGETIPQPLAPACWCQRCEDNEGTISPFAARMKLCPKCRNKRCPKAQWHGFECTGSNETGQVGVEENKNKCPGDPAQPPAPDSTGEGELASPKDYCPTCDKCMVPLNGICNCGERLIEAPPDHESRYVPAQHLTLADVDKRIAEIARAAMTERPVTGGSFHHATGTALQLLAEAAEAGKP
jgi:hypothetical protein